jgi:hypothetical protein
VATLRGFVVSDIMLATCGHEEFEGGAELPPALLGLLFRLA